MNVLFWLGAVSCFPSTVDWYEIVREAFAELGVDRESVDAVFGGNAQTYLRGWVE